MKNSQQKQPPPTLKQPPTTGGFLGQTASSLLHYEHSVHRYRRKKL
jgi:hypothetical protein